MGVFDDKKFEELDWISQATEPIDSNLNLILNEMPDRLEINFKIFNEIVKAGYGRTFDMDTAIIYLMRDTADKHYSLSYDERGHLAECFKIEAEGELYLNYETETLSGGSLAIVKVKTTMDDKVLESLLGNHGLMAVGNARFGQETHGRINEVMELLGGCEDGIRTRGEYKKRAALTKRLKAIFKNNEWKIKDTELANKVGKWIADYISNGNLAAFSNFCRLKVMTHKDQPIYSMEEVK